MKGISSNRRAFLWSTVAVLLGAALIVPAKAFGGVASTKHNLGSLSSATIKSSETTEICVFCHTPHNSNSSAPMWNRDLGTSTYDIYSSQTLVATLGQPNGSSKLCLSCHDGTIALGSLLNAPGGPYATNTLIVTGSGTTNGMIASTNVAYLGIDLRNDHPISFVYEEIPTNTELYNRSGTMELDSSYRLQCTSCHDPHGTAYTKFLVATLEKTGPSYSNETLCDRCHNKRYWVSGASHRDSSTTWNSSGTNPWYEDMGTSGYTDDNPRQQNCLACHRSHGGVNNRFQLKQNGEEQVCNACHNGNAASKNVETIFSKSYVHSLTAATGSHTPSRSSASSPARETSTALGTRHVECTDCHNPHGAKSGNHSIGGTNGNIIGNNLIGGWGVKPFGGWPSAGTAVTSFTVVDFTTTTPGGDDNLEGYLCLKCHSYYVYGTSPVSTSTKLPDVSTGVESDPTLDMNPNNKGIHPVFGQGKNRPPTTANSNWNSNPYWTNNNMGLTNTFRYMLYSEATTRTGFDKITHTSKITCSDCHGSNSASDPYGPHGSNNKYILRSNETGTGTSKTFCYNCHRRDVYGDEDYVGTYANYSRVPHPPDGNGTSSDFYKSGSGTGNSSNNFGILCLTCHGGHLDGSDPTKSIQGIHGSNAGPGASGDDLGYRLLNGACVKTHTRATTSAAVQMTFKNSSELDEACVHDFSGASFPGVTAQYNCDTVATCE